MGGGDTTAQTPERKRSDVIGHCELTVAGCVARSVLDTIENRFDLRAVCRLDGPADRGSVSGTVLTVAGVDQPAVRALMIMLWDSGHDVLAMSTGVCGTAGAEPRPG
jgi:hypothetical protein